MLRRSHHSKVLDPQHHKSQRNQGEENLAPESTVTKASVVVGGIGAVLVVLLTLPVWAQSDDTCTVLKWETKTYSQSAHITRNHPVYWVSVGGVTYEIGRRTMAVEMQTGQHIKCRIDSGHMLVLNVKGKETKYDIVGSEPTTGK